MGRYTCIETGTDPREPRFSIAVTSLLGSDFRIADGMFITPESSDPVLDTFTADSVDEIYRMIEDRASGLSHAMISPIISCGDPDGRLQRATEGKVLTRQMVKLLLDYGEGLIPIEDVEAYHDDDGMKLAMIDTALGDDWEPPEDGNTVLRIRMSDAARKSGLKEYIIFSIGEKPEVRTSADGTMRAMIRGIEVEVLEQHEVANVEELDSLVENVDRDDILMISPGKNIKGRRGFIFSNERTKEKAIESTASDYGSMADMITHMRYIRQRMVPEEAIYTVVPADDSPLGNHMVLVYDKELFRQLGIRILQSNCLDEWQLNRSGFILYVENGTRLSKKDIARLTESAKIETDDGKMLAISVSSLDKDREYQEVKDLPGAFTLSLSVAFQNLDRSQKKALRSFISASGESRKSVLAHVSLRSGSFLGRVLSKMVHDDATGPRLSMRGAMESVMFTMLHTIKENLPDIQPVFLFRKGFSNEWSALMQETEKSADRTLPASRIPDMLSTIARLETAVLFLPDTQVGKLDEEKIEGAGFDIIQDEPEMILWMDSFIQAHGDIIVDSRRKETPLKEEKAPAAESRNEQIAILSGTDIIWNDGLIAEQGADILSNSLSIHPEKTDDTVLSIPPGSRIMRMFSSYGTHGKDGWHIAAGDGIPLSETLDHVGFIGKLLEDHVAGITELRRLTSTGQADISVGWNGEEHRPGRPKDPIRFVTSFEVDDVIEDDMKNGESIASLIGDGRLRCGFIWRPDLGIRLNMLSAPPDMFFDDLEYLAETPDIIMMRAVGQNPSRTAFKKMMADLERFELRADAVETVEAVLESDTDLEIPGLAPMDHPVEITAPKGTLFALVEDVVLLPNGKKPPKAYVSIWSSDMKGKYKAVLDRIPEELERRISVLLMMMRSDEKILEVIESLPDGRNGRSAASNGGKKQNGTRSVKTVSLTREFRHRIMKEKTEHTPVPRSTEGKILADVNVRKHLRYQPYGPGRSMRKLITIESYAKKMFVNPGVQTTRVIR